MAQISATDAQGMVSHWLGSPANSYLGSGYGSTVPDLLQQPQSAPIADSVLNKLSNDVPFLGALPKGIVNIFAVPAPPDKLNVFIGIAGNLVPAGTAT